jgi:hypothetical protein
MAVSQITAHVVPRIQKRFSDYATKLGVDDSTLAKLLILRDRELRRLYAASQAPDLPGLARRRTGKMQRAEAAVTAHMASLADVKRFDAYARSCGLSRSKAAGWLIDRELSERWLERVLRME